jgi:MFS family permease
MQYAERPLSADALRLLDRKNTGRVSTGRSPGALEESKPARHGSIRRWTQWPPEHPNHEKQPLMTSAVNLNDQTYNNLHAVPDDSMVPSKRVPLSGLHEMMSASMTLSKESEEILKDRAVTCAIACSSMILLLQGLQGLQGLAFSYFMKDELKVSPAMLTSISSISGLPWVIKPLYGFASDAFPILGYHRKPYLFMAGVLGFISWVCMAEVVTQVWEAAIFITLPSLGMAVANVIGEALVVEKSRGRSQEYTGRLQTIIYSAKETGAILSGFTGGWLLSFMTARHVFLLASFIPLVFIIVSLVLQEERNTGHGTEWSEVQNNVRKLYHAFCRPQIWKPVAFLFFYNCTPSSGSCWFFFYTDVTKFSSTFLGTQSLVGSVFSLVGVLLFDATLRKVSFLPIFGNSFFCSMFTYAGTNEPPRVTQSARICRHFF